MTVGSHPAATNPVACRCVRQGAKVSYPEHTLLSEFWLR